MNLGDILVYLAKGASTAFDVIIEELHSNDLKSLRYISREVSDILVPYVFHASEVIHISAYGPDLDLAQAVLANPLLRSRVRKLVWEYSILDHELLRYAWYSNDRRKLVGDEWQRLCSFIYDHTQVLASGFDTKILEYALLTLPQLTSVHVVNANLYMMTSPTRIRLTRQVSIRSPTTAIFGMTSYSINLLEGTTQFLSHPTGNEKKCTDLRETEGRPGRFRHLEYMEDPCAYNCCCWVEKATPDRIIALLTAMAQAPHLNLREFIVSSSKGSECGKVKAWTHAFETCSRKLLAIWASRFAYVENLQLFMDDEGHVDTHAVCQRNLLQSNFEVVLRAAHNLEDLQISCVGWDVIAMLSKEGDVPYPRLRRLFIATAQLELKSLTEFCCRHIVNLQVLDIRNSQLTGGLWQDFIDDLTGSTNLPLNEIPVHGLNSSGSGALRIRLHWVFETENDKDTRVPMAFRCVYQKPSSRSNHNLETFSLRKGGCSAPMRMMTWTPQLSHPSQRRYCETHCNSWTPWFPSECSMRSRLGLEPIDYA